MFNTWLFFNGLQTHLVALKNKTQPFVPITYHMAAYVLLCDIWTWTFRPILLCSQIYIKMFALVWILYRTSNVNTGQFLSLCSSFPPEVPILFIRTVLCCVEVFILRTLNWSTISFSIANELGWRCSQAAETLARMSRH